MSKQRDPFPGLLFEFQDRPLSRQCEKVLVVLGEFAGLKATWMISEVRILLTAGNENNQIDRTLT